MESIILAAGFASRFNFKDSTFKKFMLPLRNSVLLNYVMGGMFMAGINKINIIIDENVDQRSIIESFNNFIEKSNLNINELKINFIPNLYPERENGYSLFLGVREVKSLYFILSMADHIFSINVYLHLINNYNEEDVVLATDPMEIQGMYDLDDCTKVLGESKQIKNIGKKIPTYNRLDMGAFIMKTSTIKEKAQQIEKKLNNFGVSDILLSAIEENLKVNYFDFPNTIWIDVDNEIEYNKVKNTFYLSSLYKPFELEFE
ncbi:MAG: NTP transferase domain-containing protein [Promethearchaeota archaeon]